jgi:hypothetical protein
LVSWFRGSCFYLCEKTIGFKKTNIIWNNLLNNNDQVSEIDPKNFLGNDLIISTNESFLNQQLFNLKTA